MKDKEKIATIKQKIGSNIKKIRLDKICQQNRFVMI